MSGDLPLNPVVSVEELLPEDFVQGHSVPLPAGQPRCEDVTAVQVEEDLEEDAVREEGLNPAIHHVILPPPGSLEGTNKNDVGHRCSRGEGEGSQGLDSQALSPSDLLTLTLQPYPHLPGKKAH